MRIIALLLIFGLASCASVEKRTDRHSGVGFGGMGTAAGS